MRLDERWYAGVMREAILMFASFLSYKWHGALGFVVFFSLYVVMIIVQIIYIVKSNRLGDRIIEVKE